jgi:hypothetical protein
MLARRFKLHLVTVTAALAVAALCLAPAAAGDWPNHYPDSFDGRGRIDRITNDEAVIGDRYYELALGLQCNTPEARSVSRLHFEKGDSVGFRLNDEGKIESLWLTDGVSRSEE